MYRKQVFLYIFSGSECPKKIRRNEFMDFSRLFEGLELDKKQK